MTSTEYKDLVKRFGQRQAEFIRSLDESAAARKSQNVRLESTFGSRATAPPPAAVGNTGTTSSSGKSPAAFSSGDRNEQLHKKLDEVLEGIQELLAAVQKEPAKPGFDKKGRFTPSGPGREPTATSKKEKDGFMQHALAAFVHNLRMG